MIFWTPFGLNEKEYEKKLDARVELNKYTKVYLDIIAIVRKDGKITPISFKWDDREYKIDKVLECFKGMSAKHYIKGLRYKCRIGTKDFYLFFDEEKWYVEVKK